MRVRGVRIWGGAASGELETDMLDIEFGDEKVPESKEYKSGIARNTDVRTLQWEIYPGGLVSWEQDVGLHV